MQTDYQNQQTKKPDFARLAWFVAFGCGHFDLRPLDPETRTRGGGVWADGELPEQYKGNP